VLWKGPVSVLIDISSAGPAELLASAFANTKRGELVGERTFGLASQQKLITMDDGGALILTIANYYNADGKSILEEGVTPTTIVRASNASDDSDDGGDDVSSTPDQKEAPATPRPLSADDPVLRKALELLNTPAKKAA
jgi:carboxyl-terminal processing protease